ncbi:PepSY-associated TM helix domain-containing protein [Spongiimicrobium salis]|uniref:PepSY-associated TM helix domain-containing protein n=1 Tax=Spongiimicrobium salis TaxID=1667022 RepID=UPI00374D5B12
MKFTQRNIHRDVAYFYIGLIISFSFSGILLNHRRSWNPGNYTYDAKEVQIPLPTEVKHLDDAAYIKDFSKNWDLAEAYDGHRLRGDELRVYFEDNIILDVDTNTGKGLLEYKRKTPIINQTIFLHKNTNSFWIWYSDVFGIAMLTIAITGMFITKGKNSFKKRGWKLALAGILVPLVVLILFG